MKLHIHEMLEWPSGQIRTDGRTVAQTHAHTPNCCCNNYVSLTESELDKNVTFISDPDLS